MPIPRLRLAAFLIATAPSAAPAADTAGPVDIGGGREMYVECQGEGAPAVVIVAGAKASAADWTESARPVHRMSLPRSGSSLRFAPTTGRERR